MGYLFLPNGRMRRTHFAPLAMLFGFLGLLMAAIFTEAVNSDTPNLKFAVLPFILLLAWPHAMIGLQRAHDIGSPAIVRAWIGWILLNGLALIGLMIRGTALHNRIMPDRSNKVIITEFGQEIVIAPAVDVSGPLEMFGLGLIMLAIAIGALLILGLFGLLLFAPGDSEINEYGENPRWTKGAH